MNVNLLELTIRELVEGYQDNEENGVLGYDGRLDIRPPYQREFVYKDSQRDAVIETVKKGFPLNVMYWASKENGEFEIIDGQQRTISICQYVNRDFSLNGLYFKNLPKDKQEQILNYKLTIYVCSGTESEKLDWFKTINIAGEQLFPQELRNAVYSGPWVTDAKRHFSKRNSAAYGIGGDYLSGSAIRQDYLETVIKWMSETTVEEFMAERQYEPNANELWLYFKNVINWVEITFPNYRKEMKGIEWGYLYNKHKDEKLDPIKLEEKIIELMMDDDVTNKKGIYTYLLNGEEKNLSIRTFSLAQKRETYEKQKGICPVCNKKFDFKDMEADHKTPWSKGGRTIPENCQMLCIEDNRKKSGK